MVKTIEDHLWNKQRYEDEIGELNTECELLKEINKVYEESNAKLSI